MLQGRRKTLLDKCSTASPIRGTHKLHTLPPVRKVTLLVYCSYNEMAQAETIINLSFVKWRCPSNLACVTVQVTTGSQVVHISW